MLAEHPVSSLSLRSSSISSSTSRSSSTSSASSSSTSSLAARPSSTAFASSSSTAFSSPTSCSSPAWPSSESRVDVLIAEAAYIVLVPRLRALAPSEVEPVRGDVQLAAAFALGVARFLERPAVQARFARLREIGEAAEGAVDLDRIALAAWYAAHRVLLESGAQPPPLVPVALVDEAMALRARLLPAAERRLAGSADEAEVLARLRSARSCEDLACDLLELGARCGDAEDALCRCEPAYREGDASRARTLGVAMLEHLEKAAPAHRASFRSMLARAWTLLLQSYGEVRRAALFLFGGEAESRFPPLLDVARKIREPGRLG